MSGRSENKSKSTNEKQGTHNHVVVFTRGVSLHVEVQKGQLHRVTFLYPDTPRAVCVPRVRLWVVLGGYGTRGTGEVSSATWNEE